MTKKEVRIKYKELRQKLSIEELEEKSLAIANQLLKLDIWENTYFHVFLPIEEQKEVNSEYILTILQAKDKEIVISKSDFENSSMTHFLLTDNTKIKKNNYNIPEPINGLSVPTEIIDVVFVPLLAYDKQGNRVGYGKGFYDKFLSQCNDDVVKIGLSFFEPEELIEDTFENDVKLNFCVNPNGTICF
jgi:5-formyltetrahydrofolate cyclo-ligase